MSSTSDYHGDVPLAPAIDTVRMPVQKMVGRRPQTVYVNVKRCSAWSPEGDRCELPRGHDGSHEPWQGSGYAFGGTEYECPPPQRVTVLPSGGKTDVKPHGGSLHILHHVRWVVVGMAFNIVCLHWEHLIYNATLGHILGMQG
jgi:hypothetical protein